MTALRTPFHTFPGTITLGNLDELLGFHRATFGGYRMEDDPADSDGSSPPPDGDRGKSSGFQPIQSQEDLDRIVGARLAREREKFADYGDLKQKAAEYDKALEAAKTDQERAVEAARREGETSALERANGRLVAAEARALAAEARFANPALVVRALDLSGVAVREDGSVDGAAIKAELDKARESGAFVLDERRAPRPDPSQGGAPTPGVGSSVDRGRQVYEQKHAKRQPPAA